MRMMSDEGWWEMMGDLKHRGGASSRVLVATSKLHYLQGCEVRDVGYFFNVPS